MAMTGQDSSVWHGTARAGRWRSVRTVAPYKVSVLLQGERARARKCSRASDRRDGPFVVQDCGTLTETLLESELFGHVRGAFTGAVADHPGLFVLADGGAWLTTPRAMNQSAFIDGRLP